MKVKAQAKWAKGGERKARRVVDVIRGKMAVQALSELSFMPHKGARIVEKVIKAAVANARNNFKLNEALLYVSEAYVDGAAFFKRFKAASKGRAAPRKRRNCHVTVYVSEKGRKV